MRRSPCIGCEAPVRYALCAACRRVLPSWLRVPRGGDRAEWVARVRDFLERAA